MLLDRADVHRDTGDARRRSARVHSQHLPLLSALDGKLPAIAVGVMKPYAHVRGAGSLRADFVARIFYLDLVLLQVLERSSQRGHVGQMKRHVTNGFR